jgi:hypothetical protein
MAFNGLPWQFYPRAKYARSTGAPSTRYTPPTPGNGRRDALVGPSQISREPACDHGMERVSRPHASAVGTVPPTADRMHPH